MFSLLVFFALLALLTQALNFDFEKIQLTDAETRNYSSIRFSSSLNPSLREECRYVPGDQEWPTDAEWARLNETLGGVLLKPAPLASACYTGPLYDSTKCATLKRGWSNINIHSNDPTSIMSQWASGDTCVPTTQPNSTCTQGGYPIYVVNATTVRHIQMAVNFARNRNIRFVIKGGGHDFNGKSIGGNALSVWTRHLKGYNFHANYNSSTYTGRAIALAGGFQAMDAYAAMYQYNITMLSAGGPSVTLPGGWFQGAGHSTFASTYGLAADNVLSVTAVTASGRLVTADAENNEDLFWAFRGGGGGTWGIVTSMVIRVFPQTPIATSSISFSTVPRAGINTTGLSNETFWDGIKAYLEFSPSLCDKGGFAYNFIRHQTSLNVTGLTFTSSITLVNRTIAEQRAFVRPFLEKLNGIGIPLAIPPVREVNIMKVEDEPVSASAIGDTVGNTLIASRLFTRTNYDSPDSLSELHLAIRDLVENGGYELHGQVMSPRLELSGNPDNAVHPAWRETVMHTQGFSANAHWDGSAPVEPYAAQKQKHDRLQEYMQKWRDITPGSGSYMNEGDMQDPTWKDAFFGENYARLVGVKKRWDPEGLFWVISGVGSDEWEVRDSSGGGREGIFTQDGRLCRV